MHKELTTLDIKMLRALWETGPRNLSRVARALGIHRKTLQSRIERMKADPNFFLRMHFSVYHTNIGLRKAVIFLEAPGMEQLLRLPTRQPLLALQLPIIRNGRRLYSSLRSANRTLPRIRRIHTRTGTPRSGQERAHLLVHMFPRWTHNTELV